MIHLRTRTECSFRTAVGKIPNVISCLPGAYASITDRNGTWGHVKWSRECKKAGKVPIFGVELAIVADKESLEKQPINYMSFLARTDAGLKEIYETVTLATEKFYYVPRLDYDWLNNISSNVLILSGTNPEWAKVPKGLENFYVELNPLSDPFTPERAKELGYYLVATGDNIYPRPTDSKLYEVILGEMRNSRTVPGHILTKWEWLPYWPGYQSALDRAEKLAAECKANLPSAQLVHPEVSYTLEELCVLGARKRKVNILTNPVYRDRLKRELTLIAEKKFEDYFFVVADMIAWAKDRMLVGPARGSSCGSLVCYLIGITDIDPLPYDLLFERFIDVNREDYPDIDIDFQDDRRELVFEYLREKYGHSQVTRLGTINFYKAKSALGDCARELSVPLWEIENLKSSIVERSSGDARAQFCILDTFEQLEIGRETLRKYPELALSAQMEGHARHTGMHAAGILVTALPVTNYCAVNIKTGTAMLDKYDAETLNLLKIDALGLRTLSVIQDTLDQIGWSRDQLRDYPTDDKKAFEILNQAHFAGIFQFEGYALQSICKQMPIESFEDVATITALARPGPLNSGGTSEFVKRRTGKAEVVYLHPLTESITRVTFGVIVYQEQVMQIARHVGALSWEDVSQLRKAMSGSKGKEFFDRYWEKFKAGTDSKGIPLEDAQRIWDNINTMGSWAFNRSHAIAYGMMSYWCLVLKAHFPLEFAASCLRNAKDDQQSIHILRELSIEGYSYKPYDRHKSVKNWSVQDGCLVGGLTAIKGIGEKLAETILKKRSEGTKFTPREETLLSSGITPWDKVFECADRWGHIIANPEKYEIKSPLTQLEEITAESNGVFVFIAKLSDKSLRDHNELQFLQKRGGRKMTGQTLYLNLVLEDDSGSIIAGINRHDYPKYGLPLIESGKIGEWFLWKGENRGGFRRIRVQRWRKLTGNQQFTSDEKKLKKTVSSSGDISDTESANNGNSETKKRKRHMGNLTAKMTRDIDPKTAQTGDLVAWYNENSGSKPIAKFKDRETAEKRVAELKAAILDLSSGSSKPSKAPKAEKKGAKAPKGAAKANGEKKDKKVRVSATSGKKLYRSFIDETTKKIGNPRRPGSFGFRSYELIKDGMTYDEYIAAGGRSKDLAWDVSRGWVTLK